MKKLFGLWTAAALFLFGTGASALCADAADSTPEAFFTVMPAEITMTEGEVCRLQIEVNPAFAAETSFQMRTAYNHALVSADGTVTAYKAGEDTVTIHAFCPDGHSETGTRYANQSVKILVQRNEALPEEVRTELERLRDDTPFCEFRRRSAELLGTLPEHAPRITSARAAEILERCETPEDMLRQIEAEHGYPDLIQNGTGDGLTLTEFWLDDKGSGKIQFAAEHLDLGANYGVFCCKVLDDGTVTAREMLYPAENDFEAVSGLSDLTDLPYVRYHQLPYDSGGMPGDINENGVFNSADAVTLRNHLLNRNTLPDTAAWDFADMNRDRMLSAADLTLLKRALLEKEHH